MPDTPPAIPDHTLLHLIGRGSYGEVWLARNIMGTLRAVKLVRRASFDSDRPYEREFEGIRKCEPVSRTHEGLIDVLHMGRDDAAGFFYYVMELADAVEGKSDELKVKEGFARNEAEALCAPPYRPLTLSVRLSDGPLPAEDCLLLAQSLAGALAHLHDHGLIHRDVKPSNILYVGGVPRLGDIGLVAEAGAARSFVGTEGYVPLEGPGSVKADLFGLGRVLYEALTGLDRTKYPELPDTWTDAYDFDQRLELNEIVLRACEDDPERRYRNARELLADAAAVAGGRSLQRMRYTERRLRAARTAGMVAALVALVSSAGFFIARRQAASERGLRERAEQAEHAASAARWEALCAQTRAARQNLSAGAVTEALQAAEAAADLRVSPALRSDAAFLITRPDLTPRAVPARADRPAAQTLWLDLERRRWLRFPYGVATPAARRREDVSWESLDGGNAVAVPGPFTAEHDWNFSISPSRSWLVEHDGSRAIWHLDKGVRTGALSTAAPAAFPAIVLDDGTVVKPESPADIVWHDATGQEQRRLTVPDWTANALSMSPDGKSIVLAHEGRGILCVDAPTGTVRWRVDRTNAVWPVTWSPDSMVFHLLNGGTSTVWEAATGASRAVPDGLSAHGGAHFCFVGSRHLLASTGWENVTYVHDITRGRQVLRLNDAGTELCFSAGQRLFGVHEWSRRGARLYDWHPARALHVLGAPGTRSAIAFTPDERHLVSLVPGGVQWWALDPVDDAAPQRVSAVPDNPFTTAMLMHPRTGEVTVYAPEAPIVIDGSPDKAPPHPLQPGTAPLFPSQSADGRVGVFYDTGGALAVWRDGVRLPRVQPGGALVDGIAGLFGRTTVPFVGHADVNAAGTRIATVNTIDSATTNVIVWDLPSGNAAPVLTGIISFPALRVVWSPDGRWLCSCGVLETVVHDAATLREVVRWPRRSAGAMGFAAFSPDGSLLLHQTALDDFTLRRTGTWEEVISLRSPTAEMLTLPAFSPSGRWLAGIGNSGAIQLWDLTELRSCLAARGLDWDDRQVPPGAH